MNTRGSVFSGHGLVWLPLTTLAVSILSAGCETGVGLPSSPASQAVWKGLARRCGLATNVEPFTYDIHCHWWEPSPVQVPYPGDGGFDFLPLPQTYPGVEYTAGLGGGLSATGSSPSSADDSGVSLPGTSLPGTGLGVWPGGP